MKAIEPIFPSVPTPSTTPVSEAARVIETVGVEVLESAPYIVSLDPEKPDHANDVIPFASTLRRVG